MIDETAFSDIPQRWWDTQIFNKPYGHWCLWVLLDMKHWFGMVLPVRGEGDQ